MAAKVKTTKPAVFEIKLLDGIIMDKPDTKMDKKLNTTG
jgi:hypothetical protein